MNHRGYVAGPQLSTDLHVSTKTIVRYVKRINEKSTNGPIIESKRGRGYRLNYQNYLKEKNETDSPLSTGNLTTVERRNEIIKELLITSPEKHLTKDMFSKFFVSDSVISSDLMIIRDMLNKYHLELRRRNEYVWVDGPEPNIREAINSLLVSDDVNSISHFLQDNQYIRQQDASFVTRQLNYMEEQLGSEIPYPYNVNLFSHLYVLIQRYHNVSSLDNGETMTPSEEEKLHEHPRLYRICKKVIANLNQYLNTRLPNIEIYYLFQYLTSTRVSGPSLGIEDISDRVRAVTDFLIDKVTEDEQYSHLNSNQLFTNLAKHMKPLLNRLENNIKVKNNLLGQINLEYSHLFNVVKNATKQLSHRYDLNTIDDAEVGFITLYFAQAAESMRPPINVMIVCTTGFGTAQLLKAKINKRFSELNVVGVVAGRELEDKILKHPNVDLVISTITLSKKIKTPVLIVSAILTLEDQERLEQKVDEIRKKLMRS